MKFVLFLVLLLSALFGLLFGAVWLWLLVQLHKWGKFRPEIRGDAPAPKPQAQTLITKLEKLEFERVGRAFNVELAVGSAYVYPMTEPSRRAYAAVYVLHSSKYSEEEVTTADILSRVRHYDSPSDEAGDLATGTKIDSAYFEQGPTDLKQLIVDAEPKRQWKAHLDALEYLADQGFEHLEAHPADFESHFQRSLDEEAKRNACRTWGGTFRALVRTTLKRPLFFGPIAGRADIPERLAGLKAKRVEHETAYRD